MTRLTIDAGGEIEISEKYYKLAAYYFNAVLEKLLAGKGITDQADRDALHRHLAGNIFSGDEKHSAGDAKYLMSLDAKLWVFSEAVLNTPLQLDPALEAQTGLEARLKATYRQIDAFAEDLAGTDLSRLHEKFTALLGRKLATHDLSASFIGSRFRKEDNVIYQMLLNKSRSVGTDDLDDRVIADYRQYVEGRPNWLAGWSTAYDENSGIIKSLEHKERRYSNLLQWTSLRRFALIFAASFVGLYFSTNIVPLLLDPSHASENTLYGRTILPFLSDAFQNITGYLESQSASLYDAFQAFGKGNVHNLGNAITQTAIPVLALLSPYLMIRDRLNRLSRRTKDLISYYTRMDNVDLSHICKPAEFYRKDYF